MSFGNFMANLKEVDQPLIIPMCIQILSWSVFAIKLKRNAPFFFDILTETLDNSPFSDRDSRDLLPNGG